jgi:hypothetical protein
MGCAVYERPSRPGMVGRLFQFDSIEEIFETYLWDKDYYRIYCGAILIDKHGKMWSIIKEDHTWYCFNSKKDGFEYYYVKGEINGW